MGQVLVDGREAAGLELLAGLAVQEAALCAARACQLHDSAVLSRSLQGADGPERFLVIDVAGTLRVGQLAAQRLLGEASRLVEVLTGTLSGLSDGRVLVAQSRVVLEETGSCSEAVAAEVDRRLHAGAPAGLEGWSARRLHDRVRRLVLAVEAELEPQVTVERERTAREGRRVSVRPEPDGMGSLWALLPAEQLRVFTVGLDELCARQRLADRQAGVVRTADQRRADVLAMLPALGLHALAGTAPGPGCGGHAGVVLNIHVPLSTALGLSDAPATLEGYGPIAGATARRLLPTAVLRRIVVDDTTGQPLHTRTTPTQQPGPQPEVGVEVEVGSPVAGVAADRLRRLLHDQPLELDDLLDPAEPQHDPSAPLARFVRLRDPLCTGPGCSSGSSRCDHDHEVPWPQGPTAARNLRPRSRRCHRAKTFSWTVLRAEDGSCAWTSPTGRTYPVPPAWDPPPTPRPARPHQHEQTTRPGSWLTAPDQSLTEALDRQREDDAAAAGSAQPGRRSPASSGRAVLVGDPLATDDPAPF